jgi:hypothetical protein
MQDSRDAALRGLVGLVLPHTVVASKGSDSTKDNPSAIAVFGGLVTKNNWEDALAPWSLNYRESFLAGLAISQRIAGSTIGLISRSRAKLYVTLVTRITGSSTCRLSGVGKHFRGTKSSTPVWPSVSVHPMLLSPRNWRKGRSDSRFITKAFTGTSLGGKDALLELFSVVYWLSDKPLLIITLQHY